MQHLALAAGGAQVALELGQVALHQGLERGVDGGRRGARKLADDRVELVRERIGHARHDLGDQLADAKLVVGVHDGPEKRHRHRLDPLARQAFDDRPRGGLVQLALDTALGVDPLRDLEGEAARNVGRRELHREVERLALAAVAVEQRVGKTLGREQRRLRHLALDDRVGGPRGAVDQHLGLGEQALGIDAGDVARVGERLAEALEGALDRGQRLADREPARLVGDHDIGKRAAGIDGNAIAHGCLP